MTHQESQLPVLKNFLKNLSALSSTEILKHPPLTGAHRRTRLVVLNVYSGPGAAAPLIIVHRPNISALIKVESSPGKLGS
jgi:hypothetical protein